MTTETPRIYFYITAKCILNSRAFITAEDTLSFDQKEGMIFASGPDALTYLAKLIHRQRRDNLDGQFFLIVDGEGKMHHSVSLS